MQPGLGRICSDKSSARKITINNKVTVESRLCPRYLLVVSVEQNLVGIQVVILVVFYRRLGKNMMHHRAIMWKCDVIYDVIHKTGSTWLIATPPREDRAMATNNMQRKFGEVWPCCFEFCERTDRQTDRQIYKQTNKQRYTFITILRTPSGGEVIVNIIVIESSGLVWGYVHIIDVKQKGKNGRKYA